MVKKQSLGNPQFHIRIDRQIAAIAEERLGGREGVVRYIKAQFAREFDADTRRGDVELQALKALNVKTLAVAANTEFGVKEIVGVLKTLNEHLDKLEATLKKIEGAQNMTQRAILLLAERLGVVEARESVPTKR